MTADALYLNPPSRTGSLRALDSDWRDSVHQKLLPWLSPTNVGLVVAASQDVRVPNVAEWFSKAVEVRLTGRTLHIRLEFRPVATSTDLVHILSQGMVLFGQAPLWRELAWPDGDDDVLITALAAPILDTEAADEAVMVALADPEWEFRTVEGIARTTGLDIPTVRHVLRKRAAHIRGPLVPDPAGRELYTLESRKISLKERYLYWRSAFLGRPPN